MHHFQSPLAGWFPKLYTIGTGVCPHRHLLCLITSHTMPCHRVVQPEGLQVLNWFYIAEGRWRLYYAGVRQVGGPGQGIGLAMTDKEDMEEFEGVRVAFRRRV